MRKLFAPQRSAVVFSILLAGAAACSAEQVKVGQAFPNFTATDVLINEEISLAQLKGKVVVIDFWATWCGPCVAEIPNVKAAYKKYHDKGLEIVSVSLDSSPGTCRSYVTQNQMNWRHICDGKGWQAGLAQRFGITSIPAMFVIGRDGRVIAARVRGSELERAIEEGLGSSRSPQVAAKPDSRDDETQAAAPRREGKADVKPATGASPDELKAERWLKLARSMREINDNETARSYYQMIVETYPKSSQARTAKDEMDLLVARKQKK